MIEFYIFMIGTNICWVFYRTLFQKNTWDSMRIYVIIFYLLYHYITVILRYCFLFRSFLLLFLSFFCQKFWEMFVCGYFNVVRCLTQSSFEKFVIRSAIVIMAAVAGSHGLIQARVRCAEVWQFLRVIISRSRLCCGTEKLRKLLGVRVFLHVVSLV